MSKEMKKDPVKVKKGTAGRLIKTLFGFYPVLMPLTLACIIFNAVVSSIPAVFMQKVISSVEESWNSGAVWETVGNAIISSVLILAVFYVLSLTSGFIYNQTMAVITQGTLKKLRVKMFNNMQNLPVKFFDTNNHGDIMSHYTNDIDTLSYAMP